MTTAPDRLRTLLAQPGIRVMPCCFDALSARLIEAAGFELTFMSGFAVSATQLGAPDTGLISYGEMLDQGRRICDAVRLPVLGDGDTGYGNAMNVRRTVAGYARAGFAAVMIEDQVMPKRCGHTRGKAVVEREEACDRIRAAVDARDEEADILILARTDARHGHGLAEAIARAQRFAELGADILFVEAPQSEAEMRRLTGEAPGIHMANLVEGGATPMLPPERLHQLGYRFAAYPLTLLSTAMKAIRDALASLAKHEHPGEALLEFSELRKIVGFDAYYEAEQNYADRREP